MSNPANTWLVQISRTSDRDDRIIAEALDKLLLDHARAETKFTIISLRDLLLQQFGFNKFNPDMLRYRVRDRLRTLEKNRLLEQVGVLGKCRKVFRLKADSVPAERHQPTTEDSNAPEEAKPALTAYDKQSTPQQPSSVSDESDVPPETPPAFPDQPAIKDSELQIHLEGERHALRTEMQTVMGESEHYRQLLDQFPQEAARITPLLDAAIAQGSQLKGKLDANIKLRCTMADDDHEKGEA